RRHVRRRPELPLGLLQQLRDPPDAAAVARGGAGEEPSDREAAARGARARAALRRGAGADDIARGDVSGDRPLLGLSLRRLLPPLLYGAEQGLAGFAGC